MASNPKRRAGDRPVEPATSENASWFTIMLLCSFVLGLSVTATISDGLLPTTLENRFTDDPRLIAWIMALNPLFGFIAQPLVGIWSDRIWTPVGRRAFFLIIGAPCVAVSLALIPHVAGGTLQGLLTVIFLIVIYQFFQDVINGADHPLVADLVPPRQRTMVFGLLFATAQIGSYLALNYGLKAVDRWGEQVLYYAGGVFQMIFIFGAAFFLKEKRIHHPRTRLTPWRYIKDLLDQRTLFRLAIVNFLKAFQISIIGTFAVLYATNNLQLSRGEFGGAWSKWHLVALALSIPFGHFIGKMSKRLAINLAIISLLICYYLGFTADSISDFMIAAVFFGIGQVAFNISHKAFMTEYMPKEIIGQLTGALNIFFAVGRTIATVLVGYLVHWANIGNPEDAPKDYSVIWIAAAVIGVITILMMFTVRDYRYEDERAERKAKPY